jgi:hypothetical protein
MADVVPSLLLSTPSISCPLLVSHAAQVLVFGIDLHETEWEMKLLDPGCFRVSFSYLVQPAVRGDVRYVLQKAYELKNILVEVRLTYVQWSQLHFHTGSRFALKAAFGVQFENAHCAFFGFCPALTSKVSISLSPISSDSSIVLAICKVPSEVISDNIVKMYVPLTFYGLQADQLILPSVSFVQNE